MFGIKGLVTLLADYTTSSAYKFVLLGRDQLPTRQTNFAGDLTEFSGAGYTGGFAGAGRHVPASKTIEEDDTNQRAELHCADPAWTGLTSPGVVGIFLALIKEVTNDAASPFIACMVMKVAANAKVVVGAVAATGVINVTAHGLTTNDVVYFEGVAGGTWDVNLNKLAFKATVTDADHFTLQGQTTTGYGTYTGSSGTVYVPIPMNGASLSPAIDAEGFAQFTAQAAEV